MRWKHTPDVTTRLVTDLYCNPLVLWGWERLKHGKLKVHYRVENNFSTQVILKSKWSGNQLPTPTPHKKGELGWWRWSRSGLEVGLGRRFVEGELGWANPPTQNSLLGGKGELWGGCGCLLPKGNQECLKNAPRRSWRLWWLWEIFSQNLFLKRFFDGFVHHRNI